MTDKPKRSVSLLDDDQLLSSGGGLRKSKENEKKEKKESKKKAADEKRSKYRSRSLLDLSSSSVSKKSSGEGSAVSASSSSLLDKPVKKGSSSSRGHDKDKYDSATVSARSKKDRKPSVVSFAAGGDDASSGGGSGSGGVSLGSFSSHASLSSSSHSTFVSSLRKEKKDKDKDGGGSSLRREKKEKKESKKEKKESKREKKEKKEKDGSKREKKKSKSRSGSFIGLSSSSISSPSASSSAAPALNDSGSRRVRMSLTPRGSVDDSQRPAVPAAIPSVVVSASSEQQELEQERERAQKQAAEEAEAAAAAAAAAAEAAKPKRVATLFLEEFGMSTPKAAQPAQLQTEPEPTPQAQVAESATAAAKDDEKEEEETIKSETEQPQEDHHEEHGSPQVEDDTAVVVTTEAGAAGEAENAKTTPGEEEEGAKGEDQTKSEASEDKATVETGPVAEAAPDASVSAAQEGESKEREESEAADQADRTEGAEEQPEVCKDAASAADAELSTNASEATTGEAASTTGSESSPSDDEGSTSVSDTQTQAEGEPAVTSDGESEGTGGDQQTTTTTTTTSESEASASAEDSKSDDDKESETDSASGRKRTGTQAFFETMKQGVAKMESSGHLPLPTNPTRSASSGALPMASDGGQAANAGGRPSSAGSSSANLLTPRGSGMAPPQPLPVRSVSALAQALQSPTQSSPKTTSPREDVNVPKRNVLERAKFLQQPGSEDDAERQKLLSPRQSISGGNVLERAKFLQASPELDKESSKPAVDIPRGSVFEKTQFLLAPKEPEVCPSAADKSDMPRGKILEKAQFLQQAPVQDQRRPSTAGEVLGTEPKKVNPKTMAMFDSILQQMVRHGGPTEASGSKPARERADSDKERSKRRDSGDAVVPGRVKAIPVLPVAAAAAAAAPGNTSGEVATVTTPSAADLLKSPRRRPPPASPSTPTVAPDAVHVQFSEPDPTTGNRIVSLGTVPGLINRLTCADEDPSGFDRDLYIDVFLLVHPLFVPSITVLDHLRQTYVLTGALPSSLEEKNKAKGYRSPAVRVIQIVTHWADRFPLLFANDKPLTAKFEGWVEELRKQRDAEKKEKRSKDRATVASKIDFAPFFAAAAKLKSFVENLESDLKVEEEAEAKAAAAAAAEAKTEEEVKEPVDEDLSAAPILKELSAKELAQQLTLADFKTFSRISPSEYFHQNWVKHKEFAKNLSAMIRWFNEVSLWVMTQIVIGAEVKDRAKTISKFINAAKEMRALNNYNGIMLLLSALNNSSIRRLTAEWESVGPKAQLALDTLYELLNPDENFSNMRTTLSMCTPPVIPFMGFYLTQVTYIDENDDTRDGMINFNKMMMLGKVMLELNRYQNATYPFKAVPQVQSYFLDRSKPTDGKKKGGGSSSSGGFGRMRWMDEKGVYDKSLIIKPRGS